MGHICRQSGVRRPCGVRSALAWLATVADGVVWNVRCPVWSVYLRHSSSWPLIVVGLEGESKALKFIGWVVHLFLNSKFINHHPDTTLHRDFNRKRDARV